MCTEKQEIMFQNMKTIGAKLKLKDSKYEYVNI